VTDGRSVSMSWFRAPSGAHDQIFVNCLTVTVLPYSGALSDYRSGLSFVTVPSLFHYVQGFIHFNTFYMILYIHYMQGVCQSRLAPTQRRSIRKSRHYIVSRSNCSVGTGRLRTDSHGGVFSGLFRAKLFRNYTSSPFSAP
jgi:hypothetical protein